MKLRLEYPGDKFDIYVVVLSDGTAPALEFLREIERSGSTAHRSLVRIYHTHADHGPLKNPKISKPIKGKTNLYEFKKSIYRLLWFYHPNKSRATVLTNGFKKGDPARQQFDRAESLREDILALEAQA